MGGETRCCPAQIASRLCRDKRALQSAGDCESHHRLLAVPLKVNCREAAREATLGGPLTREAKGDVGSTSGFTARNVGATLEVARGRGERAEQSPAPTGFTGARR